MHMRAPGCKLGVLAVAVVLVEGVSDQLALEALAARRGLNLDGEGIAIVPMGGSKNIRTFLDRFGPRGLNLRLAGLCDAAEEGDFQRARGAKDRIGGIARRGPGSRPSASAARPRARPCQDWEEGVRAGRGG